MTAERSNLIDVGRVAGVFGVKGWLKIRSDTQPADNIVRYKPWWLKTRHGVKSFEPDEFTFRKNGELSVHFRGIDDRDLAAELNLATIAVEQDQLPSLNEGDYYWHQLVGITVVSENCGEQTRLGYVKELLETGANDVLVVMPDEHSVDQRERLIPYVPDVYVKSVDLSSGRIHVLWDPEF